MNDALIYKVADTFKTDLFLTNKTIRGLVQDRIFDVHGLWKVKSDMTIIVDENSDKLATAFVRILGNLWGYLVVTEDSSFLLFFDGSRAKIHVGAEKEFGLGNAQVSLKKLKPSISRAFMKMTGPKGTPWEPVDLAATGLLNGL